MMVLRQFLMEWKLYSRDRVVLVWGVLAFAVAVKRFRWA